MFTQAPVRRVISHWNKLFDGFHTSSLDFYQAVENGLERRGIPDIEISRVMWRESGILSANREYLRVRRGKLIFDICAAPFASGFFFSWWLAEAAPPYLFFVICVVLLAVSPWQVARALERLNVVSPVLLLLLMLALSAISALLFLLALIRNWGRMADVLFEIPYVGPVLEQVFRPPTYYKIDTTTMFQSMVSASVMKVVDEVTGAKGIRPLSELERKPIMRDFLKK